MAVTVLDRGDAKKWASEFKVTYPVIGDPSSSITRLYLKEAYPTQVIIDRTMTIRYRAGEDYDEAIILPLLRQYF